MSRPHKFNSQMAKTLRIDIKKPSKSTVNIKVAIKMVFLFIFGRTIALTATQKDNSQASRTEQHGNESVTVSQICVHLRLCQFLATSAITSTSATIGKVTRSLIVNHTEIEPDVNKVTSIS